MSNVIANIMLRASPAAIVGWALAGIDEGVGAGEPTPAPVAAYRLAGYGNDGALALEEAPHGSDCKPE